MLPPCLSIYYITDIDDNSLIFIVHEGRKYFYYSVGDRIQVRK